MQGPNGGIDVVSRFRTDLGNVSTRWLLVAFVAGTAGRRTGWGALFGLVATMVALFGSYVATSLVVDLGGHGVADDLGRELFANRIYLEAGLISGPLLGATGAWWAGGQRFGRRCLSVRSCRRAARA